MSEELTVEILKQIRDNTAQTNVRLERVDESLVRVDERLVGIDQRLGRVEQGLVDLGQFMRTIARDLAKQERWHNQHVKLLEKDMSSIKSRLARLEKKRTS
jgi:cob(I)alamin adenosyltransferase